MHQVTSCIMYHKSFEILDISGDAGIRAYGQTLEDAFANAAGGMYSLITNPDGIIEKKEITVEVESHSLDGLLVSWLNELIFQFDTYGVIGKRVEILDFRFLISDLTTPVTDNQTYIKARVYGEDFDPERHERRLLIKAATYHRLRIEKISDTWEIDVIFDI